uniref:DENN/MADD domain containing 6B n=1 Tax=Cyprinus carpio TaxID=7962 RepID=A0A8C2AKP2_CYPCA
MDPFDSSSALEGPSKAAATNTEVPVPRSRFSAWLECVCLVYPHDVKLTEKEKTIICFLSFPDSYSGNVLAQADLIPSDCGSSSWFGQEDMYNKDAPVTLQKEHAHFYGYVYFRQVKHVSVKRSLVVVSRLQFVNLFHSLLKVIAPECFESKNLVWRQVRPNLLPAPTVLPSVHELDLFKCFQSVLIHVQMLWELMLLGEPVVVMAPSPTVPSETVLVLPFFRIMKVNGDWNCQTAKCIYIYIYIIFFLLYHKGTYTAYKTFLHKDRALIKRLLKGIQKKRPSEVQSAILRRHLLEQTQSFILPLERYLESLMPPQRSICVCMSQTPPQIRSFSQDEFMKTLEQAGPQLTLKGDWTGLYRLKLPVNCAYNKCLYMASKDKPEVEIVDLILKHQEKLTRARKHQLPVKEELLERSEQSIIISMPEDLQTLLHRQRQSD